MQIKIIFTDKNHLTINLFDIPVVKRWFSHFSKFSKDKNRYAITRNRYLSHLSVFQQDKLDAAWDNLKIAAENLKKLGFSTEIRLPKNFDYSQRNLNKLHRIFTLNLNNHTDPEIRHNLHQININVHVLEKYAKPMDNLKFVRKNFPVTVFTAWYKIYTEEPDLWIDFDEEEMRQNYEFLNVDHEHIVCLDNSILGKSILQSFVEHDDPTQLDCTGRIGALGGFSFDLQATNRRSIYKSQEFLDWCHSWNSEPKDLPLEFPIGYVDHVSKSLDMLHKDENLTILKVDFID